MGWLVLVPKAAAGDAGAQRREWLVIVEARFGPGRPGIETSPAQGGVCAPGISGVTRVVSRHAPGLCSARALKASGWDVRASLPKEGGGVSRKSNPVSSSSHPASASLLGAGGSGPTQLLHERLARPLVREAAAARVLTRPGILLFLTAHQGET